MTVIMKSVHLALKESLCEEEDEELERVHFVGHDEDVWLSDISGRRC